MYSKIGRALALAFLFVTACDNGDDTAQPDAMAPGQLDAGVTEVPDASPDATPLHAYGEFCVKDADCASNVCNLQSCTVLCDSGKANDCRAHDAFCAPASGDKDVCFGNVQTGADLSDDALLTLGVSATGRLTPAGDADLFTVTLPVGRYEVTGAPGAEGNVSVEIYDYETKNVAGFRSAGVGTHANGQFVAPRAGRHFVVVRDVGAHATDYAITVKAVN